MKCVVISVVIVTILGCHLKPVLASYGDRSVVYMSCLNHCLNQNCTKDGIAFKSPKLASQQDFWCQLLGWSCREECRYHCMWHTVQQFTVTGETIPKFHGRWPFTRFLGMQEPASTFSSILNLAANYHMYKKIRREFPTLQPFTLPITWVWHGFAMVCMNAWAWSAVFHSRDTPFTEFMDYACALSMVMGLFLTAIVRVLHGYPGRSLCVVALPLGYLATYVRYLYTGAVNYDYNMRINVFFGALGSLLWLGISWSQHRRGRRYARLMAAFTVLSGAALALELCDFPPLGYVWDAHALWHLSTAPLPLLFYSYVIADLRHLQSLDQQKFAFKLT